MVSKAGLRGRSYVFELPHCNLFPICVDLKVNGELYLIYLTLHMRDYVEDMIFILNPNLTNLTFLLYSEKRL